MGGWQSSVLTEKKQKKQIPDAKSFLCFHFWASELSPHLLTSDPEYFFTMTNLFTTETQQTNTKQSRVDQYPPDRCCRVIRWAPLRRQAAHGCRWRPTDSFQRGLNVRFPWRRSSFDMKLGALKSLEVNSFSSAQHHFWFFNSKDFTSPEFQLLSPVSSSLQGKWFGIKGAVRQIYKSNSVY